MRLISYDGMYDIPYEMSRLSISLRCETDGSFRYMIRANVIGSDSSSYVMYLGQQNDDSLDGLKEKLFEVRKAYHLGQKYFDFGE